MSAEVVYIGPTWGLIPTQEQMAKKFTGLHVKVKFEDDTPGPLEVTHNLNLPYGAPLQPPEWVMPFVLPNLLEGGPQAPLPTVQFKDGNTLMIGRVASGPGTNAIYDVWIFRPRAESNHSLWP